MHQRQGYFLVVLWMCPVSQRAQMFTLNACRKFCLLFWLWKLYLKGECKSWSNIHSLASQCRYWATIILFTNFCIAFQNQRILQDKAKGIIISGHSLAVQVGLWFAKWQIRFILFFRVFSVKIVLKMFTCHIPKSSGMCLHLAWTNMS